MRTQGKPGLWLGLRSGLFLALPLVAIFYLGYRLAAPRSSRQTDRMDSCGPACPTDHTPVHHALVHFQHRRRRPDRDHALERCGPSTTPSRLGLATERNTSENPLG